MELFARATACPRCKRHEFDPFRRAGAGTTWTVSGACLRCRKDNSFTFTTTTDPTRATHRPDELGDGPSFVFDAETLRQTLDRLERLAPGDRFELRRALQCANELLKLLPWGDARDMMFARRDALLAMRRRPIDQGLRPRRPTDAPLLEPDVAFANVLAAPASRKAREDLAASWNREADPRADLLDMQLAFPDTYGIRETMRREIRNHGRSWAGPIASRVTAFEFRRGLVAQVKVSGERFLAEGDALFELAPIQHVDLTAPLGPIEAIAASPLLARLTSLSISHLKDAVGDRGAMALAASPHVARLRWLALLEADIGEAGVHALAASPSLANLGYLGLEYNPADPKPVVEYDGRYLLGGSDLRDELLRRYGARPWLSPNEAPTIWPPDRDDEAERPL